MIGMKVTRWAFCGKCWKSGRGYPCAVNRPARHGRPAGDETSAALTGGGPSQLGVGGSMRARDVSRPAEADLAEAERLVQVSYRPRSSGSGGSSPVRS
jgi:hypothetical protein